MTIAQDIRDKVAGASAVTLYGGYAQFADGRRVTFEAAHICNEKRNSDGRCTSLSVSYSDSSKLEFRWSDERGPRYTVCQ